MPDIPLLIRKVDQLPSIPAVIKRLLDLTADPEADILDILKLIERDQSLTAGVLKLCNSSYYGLTKKVSTINDAVMLLGFNTISNMCITIGPSLYLKRRILVYGQEDANIWRHSIATASCCEQIAHHSQVDMIEVAYTAGLLHDIGKLVLAEHDKDVLNRVLECVERGDKLIDAEKKVLGMHHGTIGGKLARRWKFPKELIDAIKYHHTPKLSRENRDLCELTYLGNLISNGVIEGVSADSLLDLAGDEFFRRHNIDASQIIEIAQEARKQVKETEAFLKGLVPAPL